MSTSGGYLFLGLTVIVAVLAAVLAFAILKLFAAAKASTRDARSEGTETAFMAAAMEDALTTLRSKERAMKARAEASERLSSEIVANLTSGLLVVNEDGLVRTMNPTGRKLLGLPEADWSGPFREVLANAAPLATSSRSASGPPGRSSAGRWRCRSRAAPRTWASASRRSATRSAGSAARSACSRI